ncbi:MAG: response regulator [Campylobacterota bacterium]|nr:response regulator [Campylobacterota bacterium]
MDDLELKQLKNYTILCVEDEDVIRKSVINTLKYYFKEVYEAANGVEGLEMYHEYKPDLILSDIEMPNKNGIQMVQDIRQEDEYTIIIMLTAYSSKEYLFQLINLHINHYILKPINSDNLLNGLLEGLQNRLEKKVQFTADLFFDMKQRELLYQDSIINLRKREKDFLLLLHNNQNTLTNYAQIEQEIWKDKSMSMSALKTFVKELRQKLPVDLILNVQQEGYKLQTI